MIFFCSFKISVGKHSDNDIRKTSPLYNWQLGWVKDPEKPVGQTTIISII